MKRLITAVLSLLLFACSSQEPPSPITVNTEGNHYHNAFFGVSVDKPEGWYAQSPEELIELQQRGAAVLADKDDSRRAMIEASLEQSTPVFAFFEVAPGTPGKLNPNVTSAAENIKAFPGIKTGCDYLEHVKALLAQGRIPYQFEGDCAENKLGGKPVGVMDTKVEAGNVIIHQRYYALIKDRHAVGVVQTYFDDESRAKTQRVIDSMAFE